MEYITSRQLSEKWGIGQCRILYLAREGRIEGAKQLGKSWMFPVNAEKPADGRTRQARETKKTALFRFPLYVNYPENSFTPPLSAEEKQLRQAQLDLLACAFDRAEIVLADLAKNTDSVYIRIAALSFRCVLSVYSGNGTNFSTLFARLNMELAQDFPYKREMALFLPWVYSFCGKYKTAFEHLNFVPDYPYSTDCLPFIGFLSFYGPSQTDPQNTPLIILNLYEVQCRQAEQSGLFYEAQEMHFLLFVGYHLMLNRTDMFYHLRKGLTLAQEHDFLLIAAGYASYYPNEYNKVLGEYPSEFSEKIRYFSKSIYESFANYSAQNDGAHIYKALSHNDYQFLYYALMGYSNQQVAELTKKSERTIGNRYKGIYEKLGIAGKQDLVALMMAVLEDSPK